MKNHLLIGLGGTGGIILKAFKKRLWREFPNDNAHGSTSEHAFAFLYVDTTDEMMNREDPSWQVYGESVCFDANEFLNIRPDLSSLGTILQNINAYPNIQPLVPNAQAMNQRFGTINRAAGQMRRAGRIMFATNAQTFNQRVQNRYESLKSITGVDDLHIMIFTGLCGGTGSGAIIDVICQCKKNYPNADITVYAMYPEIQPPQGLDSGRYLQNGYAALRELNALNVQAWAPYDITTNGRRYFFEKKEKLFNLNLFSNVNEAGRTVDSRKELPEIVANSLYFGLFLPQQANNNDFIRILEGENNAPEFFSESNEVTGDRARTKAVNTFGINRVVYPENRIREHIAYTFAQSIINKINYNEFRVGRGYIDELTMRDYTSYVKRDDYLQKWLLDDAHLILDQKIIESQNDFDTIEKIWDNNCHRLDYDYATSQSDDPCLFVRDDVEEFYNTSFRDQQGVVKWYKNQQSDRLLNAHTDTIINAIESDLQAKWVSGAEGFALRDLQQIASAILEFVNGKKKTIGEAMVAEDNNIKEYEVEGEEKRASYFDRFRINIGGRKDDFYDYEDIMKDLYVAKTRRIALDFKEQLLIKLSQKLQAFTTNLDNFVTRLSSAQDVVIAQIADRKARENAINTENQVVEVSEEQRMIEFENKYVTDQGFIDEITEIFRNAITQNGILTHFDQISKYATDERVKVIVETILANEVVNQHEADTVYQNDKILGMNVLQQLKKVLINPEDMYSFAQRLITDSKAQLQLDNAELVAQLGGQNIPPARGTNIEKQCVFISFPPTDGDDELTAFAQQLAAAFRRASSAVQLTFDNHNSNKNEIAIAVIKNLLPIRCISGLPRFKDRYNELITNDRGNALILHSEGDGSELPSMERETLGMSEESFRPYLFLAAVNDILEYGEDNRGYKGWLYITTDDFETKFKNLIGTKFTEIETSNGFTNEIRAELTQKVNNLKPSFREMHREDQETMAQEIRNIVRDFVAHEVDPNSQTYREYRDAARQAIEILNH
jgi:hypothetical protein